MNSNVIRYVVLTGEDENISAGMFETLDSVYAYLSKIFFEPLTGYANGDATDEELDHIESLMVAGKNQEAFQAIKMHWRPAEHVQVIDTYSHKDGDVVGFESYR